MKFSGLLLFNFEYVLLFLYLLVLVKISSDNFSEERMSLSFGVILHLSLLPRIILINKCHQLEILLSSD